MADDFSNLVSYTIIPALVPECELWKNFVFDDRFRYCSFGFSEKMTEFVVTGIILMTTEPPIKYLI